MHLSEWIGEEYNPGNIGDVGTYDNRRSRTRLSAIITGVISLAVLSIPFVLILRSRGLDWKYIGICAVFTSFYLVFSYRVKPRPDTENIGWFGGMVDNPLRYSDDINRFLWFLRMVLTPGRLVGIGLVDMTQAFYKPGLGDSPD